MSAIKSPALEPLEPVWLLFLCSCASLCIPATPAPISFTVLDSAPETPKNFQEFPPGWALCQTVHAGVFQHVCMQALILSHTEDCPRLSVCPQGHGQGS